jgi:hypothetical protein
MRDALLVTLRASLLLAVLGAVAWATGLPFLFPNLGPSAYALAVSPSAATSQHRRVVGGHAIGVLAGLLAYHALAAGLVATALPPAGSVAGVRLAGSAVASVALTTLGMLLTDLRHAPACATTLIVALGLLAAPADGAVVVAAILLLVGVDRAVPGVHGFEPP